MLTLNTKVMLYQACVLTTRLYGSKAWTLYASQERRLNTFHMRCLRRLLGITWHDCVTNEEVLAKAGVPSMYAILKQRRLRWLGHVCRMDDGRIPKDIFYGQLSSGSWSKGRPKLTMDICKQDLGNLEIMANNRTNWRSLIKAGIKASEFSRVQLREEQRDRRRQRRQSANHTPNSNGRYICGRCDRVCHSHIGLHNHSRKCAKKTKLTKA